MLGVVLVALLGTDYTLVLQTMCRVLKSETRYLEARWFVLTFTMSRYLLAYCSH